MSTSISTREPEWVRNVVVLWPPGLVERPWTLFRNSRVEANVK